MILIVDAGNTTITFAAVSEENDSIVKRFKVEEDSFQEDAVNMEKSDELLNKWCKDIVKALCDKELTCDEKVFSRAVISSVVMEDEKALELIASKLADKYVFLSKDNCGLDLSKYSANTFLVKSSLVGPRPPVKRTTSARRKASLMARTMALRSSATEPGMQNACRPSPMASAASAAFLHPFLMAMAAPTT